jgi:hypothetical protein
MNEPREGEDREEHSKTQLAGLGARGPSLRIGDLRISLHDCPECVEHKEYECTLCEHFSPSSCPLRRRPYYITNLRTILSLRRQRRFVAEQKRELREKLLQAVGSELRAHGRPLHYAVLARIIADRYPGLPVSPRRVLVVLSSNPERFNKLRKGVYGLKQTSER